MSESLKPEPELVAATCARPAAPTFGRFPA